MAFGKFERVHKQTESKIEKVTPERAARLASIYPDVRVVVSKYIELQHVIQSGNGMYEDKERMSALEREIVVLLKEVGIQIAPITESATESETTAAFVKIFEEDRL